MKNWPKIDPDRLKNADMCFGCGRSNPIGLKLKFVWDANTQTASADFIPGENLQGWAGFVHGGVTACVLDEAMGWAATFFGFNNVTAKMQVRFRRMVPVKQPYQVLCTVTKSNSRLIETEARIIDREGNIFAEGTSTQFIANSPEDYTKRHD